MTGAGLSILVFILRARKIRRREEEFRERYGSAIIGTGRGPDVQVLVDSADTPAFRDYLDGDKLSLISQALPKTTAALATGPLAAGGINNGFHPDMSIDSTAIPAIYTNHETINPVIVHPRVDEDATNTPGKKDLKADGPIITEAPNESNQDIRVTPALIPAYFGQSIGAERQSGGLDSSASLILAESIAPKSNEKQVKNSRLRQQRQALSPSSRNQDDAELKLLIGSLSRPGPLASSLSIDPANRPRVQTPVRSCPSNPFATSPTSIAAHQQALKELSKVQDKGKGKARAETEEATGGSCHKEAGPKPDVIEAQPPVAETAAETKTKTKINSSPPDEGASTKDGSVEVKKAHHE